METRALVVALVAILNFAVDELEKLLASDAGKERSGKDAERAARGKVRARPKDDDDDDDDDDDGDDGDDEDAIIDAVKAAQRVMDKADILKILKSKGKAARASEVAPQHRKAVIAALEKAIEDAE